MLRLTPGAAVIDRVTVLLTDTRPAETRPVAHPEPPPEAGWADVDQAKAGDVDAFARIYDTHFTAIYRYVYWRTATREIAEDLTSETFVRALRRIDTVTWQGKDIRAWLVTIARNLLADHYKSARWRLEIVAADPPETAAEDSAGPAAAVLAAATRAAVIAAVRCLNPEQQECVVLRFWQGLTVEETARVMGKRIPAIKGLQSRALRKLAGLLPDGMAT